MRWLTKILREERAATSVEYAVLLAMILMAVLGGIGTIGSQAGGMWSNIVAQLRAAGFFGP